MHTQGTVEVGGGGGCKYIEYQKLHSELLYYLLYAHQVKPA